ncbi:MAG: FtsX-like permease family protein [Acholeplasma sp.]|nr:FtsX-like permease family protein [Acholeplasma sp.]
MVMKKTFFKLNIRNIKNNISRFISMISIVLLTTAVITGLLVTAPNMEKSMTSYFIEANTADYNIYSPLYFDSNDIEEIKKDYPDVEGVFINDQIAKLTDGTIVNSLLYELDLSSNSINKLEVIAGDYPQDENHILADRISNLKVNDLVTINNKTYKISGIVKNSWYFSKQRDISMNSSTPIDAVFYLNRSSSNYTNLFVKLSTDSISNHFSNRYTDLINKNKEEIKTIIESIMIKKLDSIKELDEIRVEDTYFVFDRTSNLSYQTYNSFIKKVRTITEVFPVFFLLVAALVILSTMIRLIDDERQQIGILRSLGYSNKSIYSKYLGYGIVVAIIGIMFGYAIGFRLIPSIINDAFSSIFYVEPLNLDIISLDNIIYLVIILISILVTVLYAVRKTLKNNPATLLLAKSPKRGKRIVLEKIPFIWNKMKFKFKASFRNLFRYPNNFIMTILGVSGSLALVFTGFGLIDSINAITKTQYTNIYYYDAVVSYSKIPGNEIMDFYEEKFSNSYLLTYEYNEILTEPRTKEDFYVTFIVANDNITRFISLYDRENQKGLTLSDSGVIITEQLSEFYEINIGDYLIINENDKHLVTGITENYINNFVYMNENYYNSYIRNKHLNFNLYLNDFNDDKLVETIKKQEGFKNLSFKEKEIVNREALLNQVTTLAIVLVISAGFLAMIIIYNLANVNISEREKELATLKVLGYRKDEVANYIYREINIMTVIGVILGIPLGILIERYVIYSVDAPNLMMGRNISWTTYFAAILLTLFFTFIVELIMYNKIRKIDMISALKEL